MIAQSLGGGGIERVVVELANGFHQNNCEVHIILLHNNIDYEIPDYINIHTLSNKSKVSRVAQLRPYIYAFKIRKLLKNLGKFDLTLSNLGSLDTEKMISLVGFDNLYVCVHNTQSKRRFQRHKGNKIRSFLKTRKLKSNYNNKNIIAVSNGVKNDLLNVINCKPKSILTIHNPFDFDIIKLKSNEINNKIPKENYIIHVGRFELKHKRQDILLKAYKKSNIKEKLVLLGQGQDEEKIKALIIELHLENQVILAGFDANPYNWIKNSKLFVFSSDYEGFGNVLVESLVVGTPVVSTDCKSGPNEILIDELAKYLVPVGNVDLLSKKIIEALAYYPEIKNEYIENFSVNVTIKKYLSLIN
jgi:glycosyltransferase involved in cell wall biosynthesis